MVENLLIKPAHKRPLICVKEIEFTRSGIVGNVPCPPLRQVLILPLSVLTELNLKAGDLRENIVIDYNPLHNLPSGTVIRIGRACIRLTFHCEICGQILSKISKKKILHSRGYLGCFLNEGGISLGDSVDVIDHSYEPIPYAIKERLVWFLERQSHPVLVLQVLREIGLSPSYARAVPTLLKGLPRELTDRVLFAGKQGRQFLANRADANTQNKVN